jgi:hypothetical protein
MAEERRDVVKAFAKMMLEGNGMRLEFPPRPCQFDLAASIDGNMYARFKCSISKKHPDGRYHFDLKPEDFDTFRDTMFVAIGYHLDSGGKVRLDQVFTPPDKAACKRCIDADGTGKFWPRVDT